MPGKQAIAGSRQTTFMVDPNDLVIVGIDTEDGPEHPLWDERISLPLDEAFAANIDRMGVLETIIAIKDGPDVLVAAGRQRVRHARCVNEKRAAEGREPLRVQVMLRKVVDEPASLEVALSENAHRRNDSPLTKARNIQRYLDMGRTEEDAGVIMGMEVAQVRNHLKLLDLAKPVQKKVESGALSATAAVKFAKLRRKEQVEAVDKLLASGQKPTVRQTAAAASAQSGGRQRAVRPGIKDIRKKLQQPGLHPEAEKVLQWVLGEA